MVGNAYGVKHGCAKHTAIGKIFLHNDWLKNHLTNITHVHMMHARDDGIVPSGFTYMCEENQ